ncbi:MAG TPA: hypothetical protein PL041_00475 [Melioribacteraceae bacterium]|nr:hypothetical protein [Melioribacteraceae bacterium]
MKQITTNRIVRPVTEKNVIVSNTITAKKTIIAITNNNIPNDSVFNKSFLL